MLVSVIIPTFNRAGFLPETIESVLAQTYKDIELIVIDDGSTDDTSAVLEAYKDRAKIIVQPNGGEQRAVNEGLFRAQGAFVCIVNSDDPVYPSLIQESVTALMADEKAALSYPDWDNIDEQGNALGTHNLDDYDIPTILTKQRLGAGPGVVFRRSLLLYSGHRDETLAYTGDIDLIIRLAMLGKMIHIKKPLATHRQHTGAASYTGRGWRMSIEVCRVITRNLYHPFIIAGDYDQKRIIANAHLTAIPYCGDSHAARIYHVLGSIYYDPVHSISQLLRSAVRITKNYPRQIR